MGNMEANRVYVVSEPEPAAPSKIGLSRGTRLLDVGCGDGLSLVRHGVWDYELVVGVDLNFESVLKAKTRLWNCNFVVARGESLPFVDGAFDRAVSNVSLPYMNIPEALEEIGRVLAPRGSLTLKLHSFRFAIGEMFRRIGTGSAKCIAGGLWALINGVAFRFTGRCLKMPASIAMWESWQAVSAMKAALKKAGFRGRFEAPYVINVVK